MKTSNIGLLVAAVSLFSFAEISVANAKDKHAIQGSISIKGKSKSEYQSLAKISVQEAISIATKSTSGKVTEAALDKETGYLVYEVDVLMPDQSRKELLIDAGDGKILLTKEKNKKNSKEDDDDEDDDKDND
jgi:uncharacterized membrane protein YkoI